MRPPLPTGTILQNRYHLLSVLGQGGFGRTYLAEDQNRFNELCALKELTPAQGEGYALDKSKELFQREAQILYQIQHPQIPKFLANFEEDQRLFLVQDYVEGQTYRTLLEQRKAQGSAFSESEVMQLLRQLLPVLAHIHAKGIIHRDIAPDNIMRRERDGLPVLIDFGVVKELATRLQASAMVPQPTAVGKPGYAPSEQMQTGRAYPSSDLYSLAVTAVVLLTGREPQELFDDTTLTWYWQRWVTVSPGFGQVLNRMLSYRPGDRYQSVSEVVQALQAAPSAPIMATPTPAVPPPSVPAPPPATVPPTPDLSRMPTMAVGRRPEPTAASSTQRSSDPVIPSTRSSLWDDPWAVAAIGTGLVVLTGLGSWAVVRAVLNPPQPTPIVSETPIPVPTPTPSPSVSVTPTPKPTPTATPVTYSQSLSVVPDARPVRRSGTLRSNETVTYIIDGEQGQQLDAQLNSEGVLLTVLGPNQQSIDNQSERQTRWQGELPYTGSYYLQLSPVKGLDRSDYQLSVRLANPVEPSPSPSPTTTPPATVETEQISFPPGATETTVAGRIRPGLVRRYLVTADASQFLRSVVRGGDVTFTVRYPDGRPVEDAAGLASWEAQLPSGGVYQIDVISTQDTSYQLEVGVRN
ncbi:serine/threonine protein kinase [Leptolyngbya sp. FACHB-36]|uniref:serine/threonine-protein kinase n=1 Tax=Leptolyngbya sp. FACHB-36 TaxID=2692808 RepID=UPI0016816E85|nr:serine/threonine-protein kinase [Leptolyngbya sp. FACHB-36]MBD2022277.1 serine/threonine protein kinase [Leptolyngbya sp. FACHB-36]